MDQILIDKLKELKSLGFNSARQMQHEVSKPTIIQEEYQVPREAKKWESKLLAILIPDFVTLQEIKAIPKNERKEYIADKMIAQYNALATVALKTNYLFKCQQIATYQLYLEQAGSTGFDDPDFNKDNATLGRTANGPSFCELNNLQIPTTDEIKEVFRG